jgi:hypothetical protein
MGVVSTTMPLVFSASWGEASDYNLVPTPKGHYLLKNNFANSRKRRLCLINFANAATSQFWIF